MNILKILLLLAIAFIISCSNNSTTDYSLGEMDSYQVEDEIMPVTEQAVVGGQTEITKQQVNHLKDKKIIKDANIGVKVDNYNSYRPTLDSSIYKLNGYISNENLEKNDYNIQCHVSIRLPAENFETFLSFLEEGPVKLLYKNVSARDVTEEFIDIEARLKTKKEIEKRYIELLSKAKNIKEILEVEEKLRIIREEIEAREGRLKYLKNQVAFSSVHLQITQDLDYKYEPIKEKSFLQRLWKSIHGGWKGFITFLLFLVRIWPVILIGIVSFYYIRKVSRKKNKK